jgi:hypothetical protein
LPLKKEIKARASQLHSVTFGLTQNLRIDLSNQEYGMVKRTSMSESGNTISLLEVLGDLASDLFDHTGIVTANLKAR